MRFQSCPTRATEGAIDFIFNEGGATACDIRLLVGRCRDEVRARFGVDLREEIVYLGDFHDHTDAHGTHTGR